MQIYAAVHYSIYVDLPERVTKILIGILDNGIGDFDDGIAVLPVVPQLCQPVEIILWTDTYNKLYILL